MSILTIRGVRHLRRFQQIAQILARHGFGELVDLLGTAPVFPLARVLRRRPLLGPPQRLRMALEELGPTFVKLGQVLSTRPDLLPPAYIAELARLQDMVPPSPWEPVRACWRPNWARRRRRYSPPWTPNPWPPRRWPRPTPPPSPTGRRSSPKSSAPI